MKEKIFFCLVFTYNATLQDHRLEKCHKIRPKLYCPHKDFLAGTAMYRYINDIKILEVIRWDMAKKVWKTLV